MLTRGTRNRALIATSIGAVAALALAGCTAGSSDAEAPEGSSELPASITIGTPVGIPPYSYVEEGTSDLIGYEPDLIRAAAEELGIEVEFLTADWDNLIPGLQTDRWAIGTFGLFDTPERQEVTDILDVTIDYTGFLLKKELAPTVEDAMDLCGLNMGQVAAQSFVEKLEGYSADCVAAGEPEISLTMFQDDGAIIQGMRSGRVDGMMNQLSFLGFSQATLPEYEVAPFQLDGAPTGMLFKKDSEIIEAFRDAMNTLIENGKYEEIMLNYGLEANMIDEVTINAGK